MPQAPRISLAEAKIVDNNGAEVAARAAISVRDGSATFRVGGTPSTREDVTTVDRMGPGQYRVGFADGSWWTVTRNGRPCGCGGGRR